jgi:hypothetical protein
MTISERLLRKWRKEALKPLDPAFYDGTELKGIALMYHSARERILRMTSELLDQHLLRK